MTKRYCCFVFSLLLFVVFASVSSVFAQKVCFSSDERERAERTAKVWAQPDPGYDPALGYNPANGPRKGAPPVDDTGRAQTINCVANKDETPGAGTTSHRPCQRTPPRSHDTTQPCFGGMTAGISEVVICLHAIIPPLVDNSVFRRNRSFLPSTEQGVRIHYVGWDSLEVRRRHDFTQESHGFRSGGHVALVPISLRRAGRGCTHPGQVSARGIVVPVLLSAGGG